MGRKPKYAKTFTRIWKCSNCGFEMYYDTVRCPLCGCEEKIPVN